METRLTDANEAAMRGVKIGNERVRGLEVELGNTKAHTNECAKGHQRTEQKVKELIFSQDEDR